MEHTHNSEAERLWRDQEPMLTRMREMGPDEYFASLKLDEAFELKDHSLRCMDEGTPGGIHMAGSGILDKRAATELVRRAGVTGISSHAGCGAAALFARREGLDPSKADEYGIVWAKELADDAGVPYVGHIGSESMARPAELHIARVAYFDGTGQFDPSQVKDLPSGFVISRKFMEAPYAKQEADIAVSIALGEHGFGDRLTEESPFYLVAVGDGRPGGLSREALEQEFQDIVQRSGGRVVGSGFTATPK